MKRFTIFIPALDLEFECGQMEVNEWVEWATIKHKEISVFETQPILND